MSTRKNRDCPKGYIWRRGYTRKFRQSIKSSGFTVRRRGKLITVHPKSNAIYVAPGCIKDRGLRRQETEKNNMGKLRKGALTKYGYQYRLSDHNRHIALEKAIKRYGALSVYRKLDVVANLAKQIAPDAHIIFSKDRDWIRAHHALVNKQ
jgi:hypothetical protein